ncbi:MAG TPA: glyoxylate/hydroxypyruvate reductase A [Stellaceae bacterium]|nr:glyoxylate/hydroxypyruvate reductase A [Stellaceae bacterium]
MAILVAPIGGPSPDWKRLFAAELPGVEIRMFPEIGDPADIDVAAIARVPPGVLASLPKLRLIVSLMAGQETLLADRTLPKSVPIVRAGNPAGDAMMNETALLHVLRHHRLLPDYLLAQQRREWKRLPVLRTSERRVGVLGLGQIGLATAKYLRDHGFDMAGWARTGKAIDGVAVFHGAGQLGAFLGRSEIAVNLLPLTKETEGILDRKAFALMPKGAALINLARGQHVVDRDLIDALDAGHLAAATLDVFHEEPLGKESPLWAHPRITVMPHVSRRHDPADIVPRIADNVRRLARGEPFLQPVDRAAGY